MNILIFDNLTDNKKTIKNATFVPQIGTSIDFGYRPYPKVTSVLYYSEEYKDIDVIVFCE